jgi:catechol-2,3-dioxygenase
VREAVCMPTSHAGRLVDHVHLRVRDLAASRRFYEGALAPLGHVVRDGPDWFAVDELFVSSDGEPTAGLHIAFQAADEEAVRANYAARSRWASVTTAPPANAHTTRATTQRSFSTQTVRMWRPSTTGRCDDPPPRSRSAGTDAAR